MGSIKRKCTGIFVLLHGYTHPDEEARGNCPSLQSSLQSAYHQVENSTHQTFVMVGFFEEFAWVGDWIDGAEGFDEGKEARSRAVQRAYWWVTYGESEYEAA